jgi:hypothetical protein
MKQTTERKLMMASLALSFWLLVITLGALYRIDQLQSHITYHIHGGTK